MRQSGGVQQSGQDSGDGTSRERPFRIQGPRDRRLALMAITGCTVGVAAFMAELWMIGSAAFAGWRLAGGGWAGFGLAVALLAAVVTAWALWFAPKAMRRVPNPWRALLIGLLSAGVTAALWYSPAGRIWVWAMVVVTVILVVTQLVMRETGPVADPPMEP